MIEEENKEWLDSIAGKEVKEKVNKEYRIHVAIVDHLRGQTRKGRETIQGTKPFPGLFVTHIYQGRSKDEGFFLKRLGVYAGVADLLLIWRGGFGFIEVKSENGVLSSPQRKFKGFCHALNIPWSLARSVRDAHRAVKGWGVKCDHDAVTEPDLHTKQEKFKAAFDFYGPQG